MADDESTSKFKLDLDSKEFISGANEAANAIKNIGNSESISGLIEGLGMVGATVGVLGAAFFAVKGTIEAVFDAEKIKATANQFQVLSQNAGVYADTLKKGLQESSRGWVDDTTLMAAANKAMVELETGVDKWPDLMDAARKATSVMGGDLITNFESMSQAVASGNTRLLRHLGIIIDQNKAYKDYAISIGATVDTLSKAGKEEAVMNAILAQTKEKFAGQAEDIKQATNAWNQFKAVMKEVGEVISLVIDKIAGPYLKNAFTGLKNIAEQLKTTLQATFGTGTEKVDALKTKIDELKVELKSAEESAKKATSFEETSVARDRIALLTKQIKDYEAELNKTKTTDKEYLSEQKQHAAQEQAMSSQKVTKSKIDLDAQKKQRAEYDKEIANLDKQSLQEEIKRMDSIEEANKLYNRKRLQDTKQIEAEIAAVRAKQSQGHLTQKQADDEVVRLNKLKNQKMEQDDRELARMQQQALDNYVANSENAFDGVTRAFAASADKNKMAMADWGAFGEKTVGAFSRNATSEIQAWGAGSESATQAVKGTFTKMAGEMAVDYGQMMMLASIWPPNPVGMAGGIALIALGGYLGSLSSPKMSVPSGGYGTGSMGSGTAISNPTSNAPLPTNTASQTQNGPSTHIIVNGSIFDSDATRTRMADLVRQASDSTGFSIERVGGGV